MASEPDTMRFLGGPTAPHVAWRMMATITGAWSLLGYSMFSVIEKSSQTWVGRLGPWYPGGPGGGWPGAEVGWALLASAQGRGYALEGTTAVIDWVFDTLEWPHVIHCIDADNARSRALALRLGSALERRHEPLPAPFDGHHVDIYGQSRDAWRERRR